MALPNSSEFIVRPLADRILIAGAFRSELSFKFNLSSDRQYSSGGYTMLTGIYEATINPDTEDVVRFAIVINEDTGFQQEVIESLSRAYAQLYSTNLYNAGYSKNYSGVQWPLSDRVVENIHFELKHLRPHGMGGAFRVYDPSLYATIDTVIEPFWVVPIVE